MKNFKVTGGARIGARFNATYPLAELSADDKGLRLTCPGHNFFFPREEIRRLSKYRGWVSIGLRIEHTQDATPAIIVFWASLLPWTSGFDRLKRALEVLGYDVSISS